MKLFFFFFFFFLVNILFGQKKLIQGRILDSLNKPLEYANIIAIPVEENLDMQFSLSDTLGNYQLKVKSNKIYNIQVSYIGYETLEFVLKDNSNNNLKKDFILSKSINELKEIIVIHQLPVSYKNDTLIYRTDAFVSGSERKLKEVLKKLPGVEVDKNGNITVHGKKIDKVLIEGESFFTGSSKLAVENIPADAVNTIEVIDNYNEIEFLSEVSESDELAMNITLKEDKKNFVFGDISLGSGIKERYLVHPNLFYYSPKTNFNFIGDLNNIGEKTFTIKDFISFSGGLGKLVTDPNSFFKNSTEELLPFLETKDVKRSDNTFTGLSIKKKINSKLGIDSYFIFSKTKTIQEEIRMNQYLSDSLPTFENRMLNDALKNTLGILKFSIDYIPKPKTDISYKFSLKKIRSNLDNKYFSSTFDSGIQNFIDTQNDLNNFSFQQNFEYHRKKSKRYSSSFVLNHLTENENGNKNWFTDSEIIGYLLPLQDSTPFKVFQNNKIDRHHIDGLWKHYFVLNRRNHFYVSIGNKFYRQKYFTNETQELIDGNIVDFQNEGFGNDLVFRLNDFYLTFEYKFKKGITTSRIGITPHYYFWKIQQGETYGKSKTVLTPKLNTEINISKFEKIEFNYQLSSSFVDVSMFSDRIYLRNFNNLFIGNPTLENELFHQTSLRYKKSNWFSNFNFNISLSHLYKFSRVRNDNLVLGIVQITTPSLVSTPLSKWTWKANLTKGIKNIKFKLKSSISFSQFNQSINFAEFETKENSSVFGLAFETNFKKYPNIEIGLDQNFRNYKVEESISKIKIVEPYALINYSFLKHFTFSFDYQGTFFKNSFGSSSKYGITNSSLFYQKEDSSFGFEIKVANLFNTKEKRKATFSQSIISDISSIVLPRILLFSVTYKL